MPYRFAAPHRPAEAHEPVPIPRIEQGSADGAARRRINWFGVTPVHMHRRVWKDRLAAGAKACRMVAMDVGNHHVGDVLRCIP